MKLTDNQYTFRVIFESDEDGYHGYVLSLPGCYTWGKTLKEVKANLREAIKAYVGSLVKDGEKIPQDVGFETFEVFSPSELRLSQI